MVFFSELLEKKKREGVLLTGYDELDAELAALRYNFGLSAASSQSQRSHTTVPDGLPNGVPSRTATEISGPTGSGKTAIWLSLVLDALKQGFRVLYIGCNYSQFPFARAQKLAGWNHERYQSRVDSVYVNQIDQLLVFDSTSNYNLVVIDRYDYLIPEIWSHQKRIRAYNAISNKLEEMTSHTCVVTTCGAIKHYTIQQGSVLLAPASHIKTRKDHILPVMLYKNPPNNCVLYSGISFVVDTQCGIQTPPSPSEQIQVPQLSQSNTKTPLSQSRGAPTPSSRSVKRRSSFSTPSKLKKSELSNRCGRTGLGEQVGYAGSPSKTGRQLMSNSSHAFSTPTHAMHDITLALRPPASPVPSSLPKKAPSHEPAIPVQIPHGQTPSPVHASSVPASSVQASVQASSEQASSAQTSSVQASPVQASSVPSSSVQSSSVPLLESASSPAQSSSLPISSPVAATSQCFNVSPSYPFEDSSLLKTESEEVENSQIEVNDREFRIAG